MRLKDGTDEFAVYCASMRSFSDHTVRAYKSDLADFSKFKGAAVFLEDLDESDLQEYFQDMLGRRQLSVATVRRRSACLTSFFRFLQAEGKIESDPFAVWRPSFPRPKRLPRALEQSEIRELLMSCDVELGRGHWRAIDTTLTAILLMVATGIRVGELCAINKSDVYADGSRMKVQGKGSKERYVYVSDTALKELLIELRSSDSSAYSPVEPLFKNSHGRRLSPQSMRQRLHKLARNLGMERKITPHMLRHTAATLLIERGVDIRFVQKLLGHSSIATTEIYTHVADESLRLAIEGAHVVESLRT